MADQHDLERLEGEDEELPEGLSDEIAKRWDPSRLLKAVSKRAGRGERLDATTRARYEEKFGVDLGKVRIYTGEFAQAVTKKHGAEAITVGETGMIMMSGRPDRSMASTAGEMLLAHELTHVAQAQRGLHHKGEASNRQSVNEQEAERSEEEVEQEAFGAPTVEKKPVGEVHFDTILERVLQYFDEEDRIFLERNGAYLIRP